jgi:uncharacterized membrane protein
MLHNPQSTAKIPGHPIHPMLIPFPIAFFVGAFLTDLAFWRAGRDFWAEASVWLIGAGLLMAALGSHCAHRPGSVARSSSHSSLHGVERLGTCVSLSCGCG